MSAVPFATSATTRAARRRESLAFAVLSIATALLILPLAGILGLLVTKGAGAITWEFLFTEPAAGMTAGGVYPAIVGTLWLIGVSLAISAPIGILAAIYLNEYAGDNWLTRLIHLAIVNNFIAGDVDPIRKAGCRMLRATEEIAYVVAKTSVPLFPTVADETSHLIQTASIPGFGDDLRACQYRVRFDVPQQRRVRHYGAG